MMWELLRALYETVGISHPRLSLALVAMVGALLFGGSWWLLGKEYEKREARVRVETVKQERRSMPPMDAVPPKPPVHHEVVAQRPATPVPPAPAPAAQPPNIQQHSTGANSPNIIGDKNTVIIRPDPNPNAAVTMYEFNGDRRVVGRGGAHVQLFAGENQQIFDAMIKLQSEKAWPALRDLAEGQMKKTPEWLTPALFAGVASMNLGDIDNAIARLDHVQEQAAGRPDYADADRLRVIIRQRLGR